MLATKTDRVPTGAQWLHEVKWDGVRVLVDVRDGVARMTSRNDNNVTAAWPELSAPPLGDRDLMVDGEVIALNERGVPDFRVLQGHEHLVAASLRDALPYREAPYEAPCFVLVGNESRGLPEEYELACDLRVTMPMKGRADSLNAAVAGAVLAYEVLARLDG